MRVVHYIKKNRRTETPSNLLIVDTEARIKILPDKSQDQTFRLGYAIHMLKQDGIWHTKGFELHDVTDFWKILDTYAYDKKMLYVFAHNMAYDYTILKLDTYISNRKLELRMRVLDPFIVKAGNIVFVSSTNYYPQKLEILGRVFGLSKMDSPDFENCSDDQLMTYCKRDTEVLANIMQQHIAFVIDNDLGSFKLTIAGQAFGAFRHRFMSENILVHNYEDILQLESESYRGGRCEAFRIGVFENVISLDINSMYPFVMKTFPYPIKPLSQHPLKNVTLNEAKDSIKKGNFILADCKLTLKEPVIACKRDKLIFPIGKIRQTITSPEFEYILNHPECGEITEIIDCVFYSQAFIFPAYVDYFYELRKTTDNSAINAICKVMLNSLYGKLGQHTSNLPKLITSQGVIRMCLDTMNSERTHEIHIGKGKKYIRHGSEIYLIESSDNGLARDSVPIIASTVTSHARIILWSLIRQAERQNVFYCDTDSLFVNEKGFSNLENMISPDELGKLKLEKKGICTIKGGKDYIFNGVRKLKGVKESAVQISENQFSQYHFQTKSSRYRNGTVDGLVRVVPIIKTISHEYDKGTVIDGIVEPLVFDE